MIDIFKVVVFDKATGKILSVGNTCLPQKLETASQGVLLNVDADIEQDYVYRDSVVSKGTKPSAEYIFDYTLRQWYDPRTLPDLKAAKWAQIKRDRDEAEFGGFTWNGSLFDSDAISQSRIQGALQLAALIPDFSIDWTLADNTARNLSAADLANVGAALGMHVAAQHAKARLLRSQIEAATTVAEVDAVTW